MSNASRSYDGVNLLVLTLPGDRAVRVTMRSTDRNPVRVYLERVADNGRQFSQFAALAPDEARAVRDALTAALDQIGGDT